MKKVIIGLFAICLLFSVVSCGNQTEAQVTDSAKTASVSNQHNISYEYFVFDTNIYGDAKVPSSGKIFTSTQQLNEYFKSDSEMIKKIEKYDDSFFNKKCVVLVALKDAISNRQHKVESVVLENDVIKVNISSLDNKYPGDDIVCEYHVLIELDKQYADKQISVNHSFRDKP